MTVVTNTFSETGYLGAGATHEVFQLLFKLKKKKRQFGNEELREHLQQWGSDTTASQSTR